ncbi:alpha/beta hydrolase [Micromonospora okii]|uniref:Carboxylesterase n=1 Tax=Micromonospora okii TaxID=1182970 RepID=A0A023GUI4_9ACTN|nr:alpha/beta fold hydrolase [Micromonospora okii]AFJ52680.1 carboxylesterase [Micromonospora okii]
MRRKRAVPAIAALAVAAAVGLAPAEGPVRAAGRADPAAGGAAATARGLPALPPKCRKLTFPVALTEGGPVDQRIAGTLCLPRRGAARTVQVLIPGGTYGQAYWFLRGDPRRPSYVETMTRAGYAVLAIDRLGAGHSSAPPFDRYAPDTQQAVMTQLVRAVRAGGAGGRSFDRIVLVGHSFGATLARTIGIHRPHDVDGLILTAEASARVEIPWNDVIHAAGQDPKFASRGLDPAYYTTRPGLRGVWFYDRSNAHPAVIALDELTKQPDVYTEEFPLPEENVAIRVPVLIVVGQHDRLVCGAEGSDCSSSRALLAQEKRWYPNAPLRVEVVGRTGHALNLHRSAPAWMSVARDWVDRNVGAGRR